MMELARLFPQGSEAEWRRLVEGVLKGADFDKRLMTKTHEELIFAPLERRRADAVPIAAARGVNPWTVHARLDDPDLERGNAMLLEELENGADAISMFFDSGYAARGFGLPAPTPAIFEAALRNVHADLVAIRMETSPHHGRAAALAFMDFAKSRRLPGATLKVDFGFSPYIYIALTAPEAPFAAIMAGAMETVTALEGYGFAGPFLRADGRLFHDAGAGDAQELGIIIAQGVGYLRALDAMGIPPAGAAPMLGFTTSVDQEQFSGIAKLRALRLLWARVEAALGIPTRPIAIHAETSFRMMSRRDTDVNILRGTIAAIAAALGGADSLGILPHSLANGLPEVGARRLARNTSLILAAESNLHRTIDPMSGAGAIEAMTEGLAKAAWAEFQAIEAARHGNETGLAAALAEGSLVARIRSTCVRRAHVIATRKTPITGVSEFANLTEKAPAVLMPAPALPYAKGVFASRRLAEPFEVLRDRAEALAAKGRAPKVFLANLGRIADFNTRAMFAKSAYEAGGVITIGNDGFAQGTGTDLVTLTDAFKASGAKIACISSSDAIYAEEAQDAAMALIASGAQAVHLAGEPGTLEGTLRAAGVSAFLYAGMDLVSFLANVTGGFVAKSSIYFAAPEGESA